MYLGDNSAQAARICGVIVVILGQREGKIRQLGFRGDNRLRPSITRSRLRRNRGESRQVAAKVSRSESLATEVSLRSAGSLTRLAAALAASSSLFKASRFRSQGWLTPCLFNLHQDWNCTVRNTMIPIDTMIGKQLCARLLRAVLMEKTTAKIHRRRDPLPRHSAENQGKTIVLQENKSPQAAGMAIPTTRGEIVRVFPTLDARSDTNATSPSQALCSSARATSPSTRNAF